MLKVLILGDRQSGKATFLGLLYATQVRSGSDLADEFRFHTPYESLNAISFAFQQIMSGAFPDPVTKQGIRVIDFQVDYRPSGGGYFSRRHARRELPEPPTMRFVMLGTGEDGFSNVVAGGRIEDETWRDMYDTEAIIILVDSTKVGALDEPKKGGPMSQYDRALSMFLPLVRSPSEPEVRKRIHLMFVFSKFDRVAHETLNRLNIGSEAPAVAETRLRASYAETILNSNLPRTMATIGTRQRDAIKFTAPTFYFTWVRTVPGSGKPEKIQFARSEDGGWTPVYSREEYVALLKHLGEILS